MSDEDKQTIFGFPVASIGFVDKEREAEIKRLRAELAAMTARKDGWRQVALDYRRALYFTNVDYLYHMRAWSTLRRNDRREARNG